MNTETHQLFLQQNEIEVAVEGHTAWHCPHCGCYTEVSRAAFDTILECPICEEAYKVAPYKDCTFIAMPEFHNEIGVEV